jgi:hypothetical protein
MVLIPYQTEAIELDVHILQTHIKAKHHAINEGMEMFVLTLL